MIKNIVFDIGNVLLKWDPASVVARLFPDAPDSTQLTQLIFKSELWFDLNRGKITEAEAIQRYHQTLNIDINTLNSLMQTVKESLLPIEGSIELLTNVSQSQYALYALTDNVREIMIYLKSKYDFWDQFKGIVVSAEVGYLKPAPEIYQYLINTYALNPVETIFIDDYLPNVEGAIRAGIHGIQFKSAKQCANEMKFLQI